MKNVPEIERPGRHDRHLLRRLHGADGAGQSASGAEGGGADEPDGRRLDGRRLVPLRRLPPDQLRLLHRPDHRARRRASRCPRAGYDDYENFRRAGSAGDFAQAAGLDQLPSGARSSSIRPTTRSGSEQALDTVDGRAAADGADDVDSGAVGPGRHVGRHPLLPGRRAEGHGATTRTSWSWARGATAGSTTTASTLGAAEVGRRHRAAIPARRAEAVLRSVPEGRRAEGRHAAGVHLQHRRRTTGIG